MTEVTEVTVKKKLFFRAMNANQYPNSCLNVQVSAWKDYFETSNPQPVNLLTWLNSSKYAPQVEAIRAAVTKEERDKLKATLPAITPSGIFSRREEAGLMQHSGFIQVDIDFKENAHISNYPELKTELAKLQNLAYIGLSVSGTGFWGLVPILYPDKHKAHFRALKTVFSRMGIRIDEKPGNVASLRGYSWDGEAHFNHNAKPFALLEEIQPERYQPRAAPRPKSSEAEKVEAILRQVEGGRVDITSGYGNWFALGCALANEFGEAGRDYFHRVSQWHPDYSTQGTDKQFTNCLKHGYTFSLGTFFELAGQHGLTWKNHIRDNAQPPQASQIHPQATKIAPQPSQVPPQIEQHPQPTQIAPQAAQATQIATQPPQPAKLPQGFTVARVNGGNVLEVDGIPWEWLTESEQSEARERLKGQELGYMEALNPVVSLLVERFGLMVG